MIGARLPSAAPSSAQSSPWREALPPLLVVALTGVAYGHLVGNYFWSDDFYYLYLINDRRGFEFVLTPHGGHVQPMRNLALWVMHAAFGTRAELYFAVVLLTHLVNCLLFFALLRRMTGSAALAVFGALLWSTNAFNEGSLGWLSVYGHVMVGSLLLAVLLRVQRVAEGSGLGAGGSPDLNEPRAPSPEPRVSSVETALWYLALLAASMSFGTGIGIAGVFPIVLTLWLPGPAFRRLRRAFWTLPFVVVIAYAGVQGLYFAIAGDYDNTLASAPSGLLLPWPIVLMTASLAAVSLAALVSGPYLTTALALRVSLMALLAAGVATVSAVGPAVVRRRLWACLLLSAAAYGMIAVGRAPLLVMTLRPVVEGAAAPRYHYAGSIGLALAVGLLVHHFGRRLTVAPRLGSALLGLWIAALLVGLLRHPYATTYPINARRQVARLQFRVAEHVRKAGSDPSAYVINFHFNAVGPYVAHRDFPGQAGAFVIFWPSDEVGGKQIYFVDTDAETVARARLRPWTRTAGLLVTPDEFGRLSTAR